MLMEMNGKTGGAVSGSAAGAVDRTIIAHWLIVLAAAALVFFTNLGGPGLWDEDEPKNAACAQEMLQRGDWLVPTFNHHLRTDKPILIYWLLLTVYGLFGVSEFTARLPSALLSLGTVWMTYEIGRVLIRPSAGLWGALVLTGSLMFGVAARACTPDGTLLFCTTLGFLCFARLLARRTDVTTADDVRELRFRAVDLAPFYGALGLAVLAKGPAGVVLPVGVAVAYLLVWRAASGDVMASHNGWIGWFQSQTGFWLRAAHPVRIWTAGWRLRPILAVAIVGAIALPWYVAVGLKTDGAWLAGFLGRHNVDRFLQPLENHSGPIVYYVGSIFVTMLPWSLLLPAALAAATRTVRHNPVMARGELFLLVWAGVYVGFFSLARTKLPSYVLPCYPALALLAGRLLSDWVRSAVEAAERVGSPSTGRRELAGIMLASAGGGLAFCAALPFIAPVVLPGDTGFMAVAGLIPLAGSLISWWMLRAGRPIPGLAVFTGTSLVFAATLFGGVSLHVDRYQNSEPLADLMRDASGETFEVGTFDFFRPSLVFYARKKVHELTTPEACREFLLASPGNYVVTRDDQLSKVLPALPEGATVLDRRRMFLRRRHDVVLIGRPALQQAARSENAGRR
jgi:4-amino-4-deoxy-L-arabinose transferase-like glycosyltransferase